MMSRAQIVLDPETRKRAQARAQHLGVSFAEYVRRLVMKDLGQPVTSQNPAAVFNLGSSGGSDVARDKDAMLGEAADRQSRKRR